MKSSKLERRFKQMYKEDIATIKEAIYLLFTNDADLKSNMIKCMPDDPID